MLHFPACEWDCLIGHFVLADKGLKCDWFGYYGMDGFLNFLLYLLAKLMQKCHRKHSSIIIAQCYNVLLFFFFLAIRCYR